MTLIRPVRVALALALLFPLGCASTPDQISSGASHHIDPIRAVRSTSTGWLVARVDGHPRDIEYFVNGVRIEPEEAVEWWRDAFIRIQLRPGLYELEARYLVRAFAGRGIEYRIVSRNPVEVRPGVETEVEAHLEKDWRGVPATETAYFVPVTAERRARKQEAAARQFNQPDTAAAAATVGAGSPSSTRANVPMQSQPEVTPEVLEEVRLADELAGRAPDTIVLRGDDAAATSGSITIQDAGGASPTQGTVTDDIVIHGGSSASAVPEHTAPPAAGAGVAAGGLIGAGKMSQDATASEPQAAPPYTLEGAEEFGITVSIESVPSGASVIVDEQEVGQTPVAVRLDPRADHIVEFRHDGCGDYVRLLSSNGWREGRDTTVQVQLYCD